MRSKLYLLGLIVLFSGLFSGCGGSGGESGTGALSLWLTDAATPEYRAVYVTIKEVRVHKQGGEWETAASPGKTYDLLELVNGLTEQLGMAELSSGEYTQMRLVIGDTADGGRNLLEHDHPFANYVVLDDADPYRELKLPSGMQSGYKLVGGFTINDDEVTELLLDFDAARSVIKPGTSGQWLLKPAVKVLPMEILGGAEGTVAADATGLVLEGAAISAQGFDGGAEDATDTGTAAATVSNHHGAFYLFLEPGIYNLVASREGYEPACGRLTVSARQTTIMDFTLASAGAAGTVTGLVSISGGEDGAAAVLSFRQVLPCGDEPAQVEVASLSITDGGTYSIALPAGAYTLVVAAGNAEIRSHDLEVAADAGISLDLAW